MSFPIWPVVFITGIFYLNFTGRVILAPLLPVIEAELHIGHGAAASLFLFIQVGYTIGLLTSGFISSAFTHRHTIVTSSVGVGLALVGMAWAQSLLGLRLGLVGVGAAAGLYLPAGVSSVTELVQEKYWGRALALHELAPSLAFITAPFVAEVVLKLLPWQGVLTALGAVAIGAGALFAVWGRGGVHAGKPPSFSTMLAVLATPQAWMVALLFAVGIGVSMGLYTVMTLFLVSEAGMARAGANALVGTSRVLAIAAIALAGMLVDRLGPRRAMVVAQALTGTTALLLGLVRDPQLIPFLVLGQSAFTVCFFPAGFALISTVFPQALRGVGVSIAGSVGTLVGAGALPSAIGYLAEVSSFRLAFTLVGLIALASPLLLRLHRQAI
jgi:NNP family nitrate/nitrite transporter-like MFS transporter